MLIDVHAHLDYKDYEKDLDEVIERAKNVLIITVGITPETNRKALDIAKKYENVKCGLGLYPPNQLKEEVKQFNLDMKIEPHDVGKELEFIEEQLKTNPDVVAVSEIGLDYSTTGKNDADIELFRKQLKLAKKYNKPAIVHSRKAEQDVIDIIEEVGYNKIIMHCFCGRKSQVKRIQDNDWYFSIPTNIERAQNFQQIVQTTNINRLLTETDCPFLSPFKGRRNEPAFVSETIEKIAEIKKMLPQEVENNIFKNFQALF